MNMSRYVLTGLLLFSACVYADNEGAMDRALHEELNQHRCLLEITLDIVSQLKGELDRTRDRKELSQESVELLIDVTQRLQEQVDDLASREVVSQEGFNVARSVLSDVSDQVELLVELIKNELDRARASSEKHVNAVRSNVSSLERQIKSVKNRVNGLIATSVALVGFLAYNHFG